MTERTYEEKKAFLGNLYNKHADFIQKFRSELVTELDPAAVEREGKFISNDSCCGGGCGHCTDEDAPLFTEESMEKAFELILKDPDFPNK